MHITNMQTEKIFPYDKNPRINNHAVDEMAKLIRELGFRVPLLVKSDGSLIDGHLRLKAAKKIGLTDVPVVIVDDLTDAQIQLLRISINKSSELAEWDDGLLREIMSGLHEEKEDLTLTGFSEEEIDKILKLPEEISEKTVTFDPITTTYVLLSIPTNANIEGMEEMIRRITDAGGSVHYAGN